MMEILNVLLWIIGVIIAFLAITMIGGLLVQLAEKIFGKNFWEKDQS